MRKLVTVIVLLNLFSTCTLQAEIQPQKLLCEYAVNPIGIDVLKPRLSWMLSSNPTDRNVIQIAYQVQVSIDKPVFNNSNMVWESGKIMSDQSVHIVYGGLQLESFKRYYWRIKYWDNKGRESKWSQPAYWEMGLLNKTDWTAQWIEAKIPLIPGVSNPCPYFRKEFNISKKVKSARLYITSRGLYEAYLNGGKIGNEIFTPGWTSYDKRIQYQTYDITDQIKQENNVVGVILGDGWYKGNISHRTDSFKNNTKLALLVQMNIEFTDGEMIRIVSDKSWKTSIGPIKMSDIYNGETYDARVELTGWNTSGYDESNWMGVDIKDYGYAVLVASSVVPVRKIKEMKPKEILTTPKGELVVDMGQNMVGWIRMNISVQRGDKIIITHAEVLDKEGNFYTTNLNSAKQKIEYTAKGDPLEIYEPHFTFQGFRYIKIEGFPGKPTLDNFTGIVIHSDVRQTGFFECSNAMINQLQSNIQWSQQGNFVDVPTDCPQRNERFGWTGDAQVFAATACFNFDCAAFYTKWLKDLKAEQLKSGSVTRIVPNVLGERRSGSTGWGDAAVIVPWTVYMKYGDKRILEEQYESMKNWILFLAQLADSDLIIRKGFHYGDWLFFIHPTDWNVKPGYTDVDLIATAFFYYSTGLVEKAAKILDKQEDLGYYQNLRATIKKSFKKEFVTANGRLSPNSQTAYVLALRFNLLDDEIIPRATRYLVRNIEERDYHLSTGFLGTPYLCHVLSDNGYPDVAMRLLLQKTYPSWLYPVSRGATTIWERWDGIKPDSSFEDPEMNSFNHYAYGSIGDWMYTNITGIRGKEIYPGYKQFIIDPYITDSLSYAKARFNSLYGTIKSEWTRDGDRVSLSVSVPVNTRATIHILTSETGSVTESGQPLSDVFKASGYHRSDSGYVLEVGSGDYNFQYTLH